jgi:hypothetical protein
MACAVMSGMDLGAQPIIPADRAAESRSLFDQGLRFLEGERWAEALACFRRSQSIVERPNTIYNIGFASFRLGRYTSAVRAFNEYLRLPSNRRDRARRNLATSMRADSLAAVSTLQLYILPGTSEVRVDGALVSAAGEGSAREIRLDPGDHSLEASATGHQVLRESLTSLPGSRVIHRMLLSPSPVERRSEPNAPVPASAAEGAADASLPATPSVTQPAPDPSPGPPVRAAVAASTLAPTEVTHFTEDFRNVPVGSTPPGWSGDVDAYMVRDGAGGQRVFQCSNGNSARFTVPIPPLPPNYRLEVRYSRTDRVDGYLRVDLGDIVATFDVRGSAFSDIPWANNNPASEVRAGVPVSVGIERRGNVIRLLVDGREVEIARAQPEPRPVTTLGLDLRRMGNMSRQCGADVGSMPVELFPVLYRVSIVRL